MYSTYVPFKKTPYICDLYNSIAFPENYHSEIEIHYCIKGSIPFMTESGRYDIKAGDILFIGSGEVHERIQPKKPAVGVFIKFGSLLLGYPYKELASLRFDKPVISINSPHLPDDIKEGFKMVSSILTSDEPNTSGNSNDWIVRSFLYRLALFLLHEYPSKKIAGDDKVGAKMMRSVQNAMSFVEDNYMTDISLDDVSAFLGYEKTYFCKMFKEATGQTFHSFLNHYRIQVACNYLLMPDIPIGDIANACGFPQFKTFCRIFKQETGITPSEYRAK